MNYLILKSIVDTTISHFACKNCGEKATDQNVTIVAIDANGVGMDIVCPNCKLRWTVKAELNIMDNQGIHKVSDEIKAVPFQLPIVNQNKISDKDILDLREKLGNSSSVEDLLS